MTPGDWAASDVRELRKQVDHLTRRVMQLEAEQIRLREDFLRLQLELSIGRN